MSTESTPEQPYKKQLTHTSQMQTVSHKHKNKKERVTFRIPEQRLSEIKHFVENSNEYSNRSEAIRGALNEFIDKHKSSQENKQ